MVLPALECRVFQPLGLLDHGRDLIDVLLITAGLGIREIL